MSLLRIIFITAAIAAVLGILAASISLTGVWQPILDALRAVVGFAKALDPLLQTTTALPLITFNVTAWGGVFFACVVLKSTHTFAAPNTSDAA